MVLSNQVMTTLSKFTLKARKDFGVIKSSDIISDRKYASNLFIQAAFSEDVDLMTLAIKLIGELNIEKNMIKALKTYVDDLKAQVAGENHIQRSKQYLIKLAQYIYGIKVDSIAYRDAINEFLKGLNGDEKMFCIDLARSFFPYWVNANNALIEKNNEQSLSVDSNENKFMQLWNSADDAFLSTSEGEQLNQYINAMEQHYVSEKEIDTRKKMATVILIEQRKYNQISAYRTNINNIQSHFSSAEMREYFLVVSREFYSFWADAQAPNRSHQQTKPTDLEMPGVFS
jgi:hypothetical protein